MRDDFFIGMLGGAFLMFVVSAIMIMPTAAPRMLPPTGIPTPGGSYLTSPTEPYSSPYKGDKLPMRPLASFSQYGFCWPHHGCEDV